MKLKKLFCLLGIMATLQGHAYDVDHNGIYYNITDSVNSEVEVTYVENGYGNTDFYYGELNIPRRFAKDGVTYTVTRIGDFAFGYCANLTAVTIPETVTAIGDNAFRESGLTSVVIPNSVTTIGNYAFCETGLTTVTLPSALEKVGAFAFFDSSLQSVDFNGCAAHFYNMAFAYTKLNEVNAPAGASFSENAFRGCSQLKKARIENANLGICKGLFRGCTALEEVVLGSASTVGGSNGGGAVFYGCQNLRTVTFLSGDAGQWDYATIYTGIPADQVFFNIPEGTAESFLKRGYRLLSDPAGLPLLRQEFEAEAAAIVAMSQKLLDGDKETLAAAIEAARTVADAADDYATVYAQIDAVKSAAKTFLTTATLPADFDVTAALLTNPSFDRLPFGWNIYSNGFCWNSLAVGLNESTISNGDVTMDHFVQVETSDSYIEQTIASLPAGVYRLEADVIAYGSIGNPDKTLHFGNRSLSLDTEEDKPQHISLRLENAHANDVAIALRTTDLYSTGCMAADNFRIYYEGPMYQVPTTTELVSSETDTLYIYNVGAQQFLNAGGSHGQHAVVGDKGLPVRMTQDGEGYWQVYFYQGSRYEQLLARFDNSRQGVSEKEEVYVDYNGQGEQCRNWIVSDDGNGGYLIQNQLDDGTGYYLGNVPYRNDYNSQTKTTLGTHVDVVCTDDPSANIHWQFVSKADYDWLMAKQTLLATIIRVEAAGLMNDELMSRAMDAYNNAQATMAEVIEATTLLNSQIGMPQENQPVDMTALIVNPRFENEEPEGWIGAKPVSTGNAQNTQHQTHEFFNTTFDMSQTITGLPNGLYRLKYKGFHRPGDSWQTACTDYAAGKNEASAVVYANGAAKTLPHHSRGAYSERLHDDDVEYDGQFLPDRQWDGRLFFDQGLYADSLEVEVSDNQLTIGVRSTDGMDDGAEWVLFSDFELEIIENAETYHNKLLPTSVKSITGYTVSLPIDMQNAEDVTSVEFMVELPHYGGSHEYLAFATDEYNEPIVTTTARAKGFSISATAIDSLHCKVLLYGVGRKMAKGSGPIANLQVKVAEDAPYWSHPIRLYDIVLGKSNGLGVKPFSVTSALTVEMPEQGDANHDMVVSVADIITVASHILNRNPQPFDTWAADINADDDINAIDISQLANIILYGTPTFARAATPVADGLPVSAVSAARAAAADGDTFAAADVDLDKDGRGILNVGLSNSTACAGYEFELRLPEGISIATDEQGDFVYEEGSRVSAAGGFVTSISQRDGYYKVLCFNDKTRAMQDNDGTVVTITLQNDGKANGTLEASLTNCRISDTFKTDYLLNEELPFTISAPLKGDVNQDGEVGIGDIVSVTNVMASDTSDPALRAAADVNGDGEVGIGDIVAITNVMAGTK